MLVVPQHDFQEFTEVRQNKKPKRKLLIKTQVVLVSSVFVLFLTGLGLTSLSSALNSKGLEVYKLQRLIEQQERENERLRLDISKLESPQRIQQIATERLGMIVPTSKDVRIVHADIPENVSPEGQTVKFAAAFAGADPRLLPERKFGLVGMVQAVISWLIAPGSPTVGVE